MAIRSINKFLFNYFEKPHRVYIWITVLPLILAIFIIVGDCSFNVFSQEFQSERFVKYFFDLLMFLPGVLPIIYSAFSRKRKFALASLYSLAAFILIQSKVLGFYFFLVYGIAHDFLMLRNCL